MSLLIPTECDFQDAHGNSTIERLYAEALESARKAEPETFKWTFETVPGFFVQTDPDTDDLKFRYTELNLGRKMSWADIQKGLAELNQNAKPNESYKLVICARHGQGYHNFVVDKYGIEAWNTKWRSLGTDGEVTFGPDAMLTELGIAQARENNQVWAKEIKEHGASIPAKFFVSPLQRSSWTSAYTWEGLRPSTIKPLVVENLRETIGQNLCDKRSTKTVILERFGKYDFEVEEGFSEEDLLHTDRRETDVEQTVRVNRWCQSLFESEWSDETKAVDKEAAIQNSFISTTTHAGTIRLFILVFGHRRFTISTGGMVPVVVKATRSE